jgi:hypothetical protein
MALTPVAFLVLRSLQTAVRGIAVADGYHYTVGADDVTLDPTTPVEEIIRTQVRRPLFVLELLPLLYTFTPALQLRQVIPVTVHAIDEADASDADSRLWKYLTLVADIERAVTRDLTRGGLVVDTRFTRTEMRVNAEDAQIYATVPIEMFLHRTFGEPNINA